MEVSGEGHSDENKHSSDNKKRRLKTPAQLIALEKFYDEHKYPTEEMKAELAVQLGLTEKQISGWFCHRRLKDKRSSKEEKCPNGRQERLSGVIQDLGQDSCGSTKHTDYRHVDLREVESRRLYGPDFQAANPIRENRIHHYIERVARVDHETSSESSSSLQDRLVSQLEDHHGGETSRYLSHDGLISTPLNPKGFRHIRYKPSGYLKVKGEVENAAITAVKRQLGRQYQEDGPLLGVDFDPLPPGAFESPPRDPIHEAYYVGNSVHSHSPDIAGLKRQLSPQSRYDEYNSKLSSRDMYLQEAPGISHGPGTQKPAYFDHTCSLADRNSALGVYDESNNKIPKKRKKGVKKHSVDGIASDSYLNHQVTSGGRIYSKPIVPWLHEKDNSLSPKMVQRSGYSNFKPRLIARDYCETPDMEERRISVMMPQQESKLHGDYRSMKDVAVKMKPAGEMAGKRVRVEFPQQENCTSPALDERLSRKNHAKGSGLEIPSSFSEDETAETSSSAEDLE